MKNYNTLRKLIVKFQGWRAILYFGAIIGMGVIDGITAVLVSRILGIITDAAVAGKSFWDTNIVQLILIVLFIKLGIGVFLSVGYSNEAKRTGANMRNIVFSKALCLPVEFYEKNHTGDFMAKLTYDTDMASGVFGSRIRRVLMPVILVCVCTVPMFIMCPPVMAGLFVLCVISLTLNFLMIPLMKKYSRKISEDNKVISESVTDMLQGMETIRMYPLKSVISNNLNKASESCGRNTKKQGSLEAMVASVRAAFDLLGSVAFLALGIIYIQKNNGNIGNLISLYALYGTFQYNFLLMGQYIPSLASYLVNAERVLNFLELPEENLAGAPGIYPDMKPANDNNPNGCNIDKVSPDNGIEEIRLDNITFRYEGKEDNVFDNFSLSFKKGISYAVVGESGRGKSTLIKLLEGFYSLKGGEILFDNISSKELGLGKVRSLIAYIPQEPYMYRDTVYNNICNGKPGATGKEVIDAAKAANAHDFIMRLDKGYDTVLGERGNTLSGGQKQRLAIARAILKDAPIIILDEATSALDNESEKLIQQSIMQYKKNKIIIMVAHRPSTIATADVVVEI